MIPPLKPDEYMGLEKSLLRDGYDVGRGKIITWNGFIIDGHNRYEICTKHNIVFEHVEKEFEDKASVRIWIRRNQLDRRNISDFVRAELALGLEEEIRAKAKENSIRSGEEFGKGSQISAEPINPIDTRQELAKLAGVSHDSVSKVKKIIESAPKHIKDKARSGELKINTA